MGKDPIWIPFGITEKGWNNPLVKNNDYDPKR